MLSDSGSTNESGSFYREYFKPASRVFLALLLFATVALALQPSGQTVSASAVKLSGTTSTGGRCAPRTERSADCENETFNL